MSPTINSTPCGQVGAMPGGEIIQHPHAVAARDQRVTQMRADEPRAAGDEVQTHA